MNQTETAPMIALQPNGLFGTVPMAEWFTSLNDDVRADITEMVNEAGYPLNDIMDFIEQYGVEAYSNGHYVTWCQLTEELGATNDAIEAYVEEVGINYISNYEDDFVGEYESEADFARQYFDGNYHNIDALEDAGVVIDWQATWDSNLSYNYAYNNGYVFNTNE
jgi:antirestriction protein